MPMSTDSHWLPSNDDRPSLRYITVAQLFDETVSRRPDNEAVVYAGQEEAGVSLRWTYGEYQRRALDVAAALVHSGLNEGDSVAVYATNRPEFLLLQIACAYANLILVPLNPLYRAPEVIYAVSRTTARACFVVPEDRGTSLWDIAQQAAAEVASLGLVVALGANPDNRGASWDEWLAAARVDDHAEVTRRRKRGRAGDISQLQLTSGTTGSPKAVRLPNWIVVNQGCMVAHIAQIDESVRFVNPNPFFHTGGNILANLCTIAAGGCHLPLLKFNPAQVVQVIEAERATMYSGVPTMLTAIEEQVERYGGDLSSLERVVSGGSAVPEDLARRFIDRYNVAFVIEYGQTEHGPLATCSGPADAPEDQYRTCGRPIPHAELDIVARGTDRRLPIGEEGEVRYRGYVMDGYHGDPAATAAVISEDGWLRSGDLGRLDERGYLRITGRAKEMIIRGGENIAPVAVEDAVRRLPQVTDVAVIGVPDEKYGEQVCAVVRLTPGSSLTRAELVRDLSGQMPRFMRPQYLRIVSEFPKTPSGKIQKFRLLELFLADVTPGQVPPVTARLEVDDVNA